MVRLRAHPGFAGFALGIVLFANAVARDLHRPANASPFAAHVTEASDRFAIPQHWIYVVMRHESGGKVRAVSRAGAMGLMQIMPATWASLRATHGLGRDPFDPRDNILAGAAYLRGMHDRFGSPGFLAAYNAGPARYQQHLDTGRPLPAETRAYLAALAPLIGDGRRTGLAPPQDATPHPSNAKPAPAKTAAERPVVRDMSGLIPSSNGLFIARTNIETAP